MSGRHGVFKRRIENVLTSIVTNSFIGNEPVIYQTKNDRFLLHPSRNRIHFECRTYFTDRNTPLYPRNDRLSCRKIQWLCQLSLREDQLRYDMTRTGSSV